MPSIANADLVRIRDALLFVEPNRARKVSRFWSLLVMSGVIATAGVVGDSTATVIGVTTSDVTTVARTWAAGSQWQLLSVDVDPDAVIVRVSGPSSPPDPRQLRRDLDEHGLQDVRVVVAMVPETRVELPPR